jgi:hypothetical protein
MDGASYATDSHGLSQTGETISQYVCVKKADVFSMGYRPKGAALALRKKAVGTQRKKGVDFLEKVNAFFQKVNAIFVPRHRIFPYSPQSAEYVNPLGRRTPSFAF